MSVARIPPLGASASEGSSPIQGSTTGTVEFSVGSIWLDSGTVNFSAMLGSQTGAAAASLRLRKHSDASILTTIGGVAGTIQERTVTGVVVGAGAWYDLTLFGDTSDAITHVRGLRATYQ